jgi:predicted ATPase
VKITKVLIENVRSISEAHFDLTRINLIVGRNNSGKSSIIRAIYSLQRNNEINSRDIRIGNLAAQIDIHAMETETFVSGVGNGMIRLQLQTDADKRAFTTHLSITHTGGHQAFRQISDRSPDHYIVPFLSKRKVYSNSESFKREDSKQITGNFSSLAAKVAMVSNQSHPAYPAYSAACQKILGFVITSVLSEGGQRPGIYTDADQEIHIDQMGEGVAHIVAMIADLALSRNKLFLIEEPENDLHPDALKAILELIVASSESNQFVISTHSNIVVTYLGALKETSILKVEADFKSRPPISRISGLEHSVTARIELLQELGYSLSDFSIWNGWLIFEESSAERIIREFLIPWFAPKLRSLRTIAANSISKVEPNFEDLNRLVRFTHLEDVYKDAVWVLVDGDEIGKATCDNLKNKYKSWKEDRFLCFGQEQFEKYYPQEFQSDVARALEVADKQQRREAKKILLNQVIEWISANEAVAKVSLEKSAQEVIAVLRRIESQVVEKKLA